MRVSSRCDQFAVAAAVVAAVAAQTASDVAAREASERCADALGGSPFADADARDARERDVADLQRRLDAARETVTFAAASQRADEDEAAAARALSAATANWSHLLDTRIAGAAGELAERLVDGEPCAVCGATSHPHPAAAPAETATPSQIDAAAAARAEGGSVDDLSARLAAAADRAAAATAAVVRRDEGVAARDRLDARVRGHEASVATVTARRAELEALGLPEEPVDVAAAQEALRVARDAVRSATDALSRHDQAAAALSDLRDRAAAVDEGRAELERTHQIVARLADTLAGRAPNDYRMPLETYVLAAELEEIVTAANVRLDEMSSGRYRLQHTDARASHGAQSGLGLEIVDAFTAVARPAHSLSGGETFLASLALALGLAEVVTARAGGIRLDTLFIDEGFGSLDAETLDLAMRTLDELRSGGRTVGVISHVEAMKEQIPAQLVVEATGRGPSIIRQSD
ncbi:SbcC/MukB-like Walker B domain-containing protein [Ralstonia pickettii]|uniref:SbcC/MukB-like Walker B domain-containing protein n=2 Tax=Bacteria TaxID=2 RepID=UPI001CA59FEA